MKILYPSKAKLTRVQTSTTIRSTLTKIHKKLLLFSRTTGEKETCKSIQYHEKVSICAKANIDFIKN